MTAFRLGLTGSIGMGKTTTAGLFAREGIPVWDADATVHQLYAANGAAAKEIAHHFPKAMNNDGSVNRASLRDLIRNDPNVLDQLNAVVHPLASANRAEFLARAKTDLVLLDIPLLYETGAENLCDAVLLVTAPAAVQKARVLARGEMTEADFNLILSRQIPDAEKRRRAHHIVETLSLEVVDAYVRALIAHIRKGLPHA